MNVKPILFSVSERRVVSTAARLGIAASELADGLNRGEKFCGSCRSWKPRTENFFGRHPVGFGGFKSHCRDCVKAQKRAHYDRTRPEQRARQIAYQRENREKLYAYNAMWQRRRNAALRAEMLEAYGGKCACCGEDEKIFLDLDHIHNDGADHRRELGNGAQVLLALKREGWPHDRFQILCCNCNQGKARNGGVCPHVRGAVR